MRNKSHVNICLIKNKQPFLKTVQIESVFSTDFRVLKSLESYSEVIIDNYSSEIPTAEDTCPF